MITQLQLKNFTAFTELSIDFSPGINIVIGENGTGKTQLLKALLALNGPEARGELADESLARKLCRLYQPLSGKVGELRRAGTRGDAQLAATLASGQTVTVKFNGSAEAVKFTQQAAGEVLPAIFIPTKEVLSLVRGLTAEQPDLPTIERIFDDGYLDLARKLVREGANDLDTKVQLDPKFASIVPRLANLIGGQYLLENGRFVYEPGRYEEKGSSSRSRSKHAQMYQDSTEWKFVPSGKHRLSSGMTAEGFRKIGVLQRLLSNGSLNPGTTGPLLWDEPESNLNPKLMRDLVQALLELARNGQQVILATHDYVLLKWFDLLMEKGKGDQVRFHVLSRDADSGQVRRDSMDDYRAIEPNAIADTFNELTKVQVARKMGELGQMKLRERDLEIDFTDAIDAIVFDQMKADQPGYHGVGQMHRVDFVVELENAIVFVEVKDPSNPKAKAEGLAKFHGELQDGTLSDTFAAKFIDTFLYRWAEECLQKPVHYISLVTFEDNELLPNFSDEIAKKLPPMGKSVPRWKRQLVENCQVFNIELWNASFPKWPAARIAKAQQ